MEFDLDAALAALGHPPDDSGGGGGGGSSGAGNNAGSTTATAAPAKPPAPAFPGIYHERQVAALCGQHCINNLLQGHYFTAASLATVAEMVDQRERALIDASPGPAAGRRQFQSANVDDSGNFSINVLRAALENSFGLHLVCVSFGSEILQQCGSATAFIVNYENHWIPLTRHTVDPQGRWFNLDSTLPRPQPISTTYLSSLIGQIVAQGDSVFQVVGDFPRPMTTTHAGAASPPASERARDSTAIDLT